MADRKALDKYLEQQGLLNYQTQGMSQQDIAARYAKAGVNVQQDWFQQNYKSRPQATQQQYPSWQGQTQGQGGQATQQINMMNAQYNTDTFTDPFNKKDYYSPGYSYQTDMGSGLVTRQRQETIWLNGDPKLRNQSSPMNLTGVATMYDAKAGRALWSDVGADERKKLLSDPSFYTSGKITQLPPMLQQQVLADPNFDWKQLPKWQKTFYDFSSQPIGVLGYELPGAVKMGAVQGALMGLGGGPQGGAVGAVIGGVLGGAAAASGYDPTKEAWQQKGVIASGFGYMNFLAENVEKVAGLGFQTVGALTDKDPRTNVRDVFTKEGWNAGMNTYEILSPAFQAAARFGGQDKQADWGELLRLMPGVFTMVKVGDLLLHPDKYTGEEIYLGANMPIELRQSWAERLAEAREKVVSGENYRQVAMDLQNGLMAQVGDMAGQAILDPLNVMGQAQSKVGEGIAKVRGDLVAEQAFKGTKGLTEAATKYKTLIQSNQATIINPAFKVDQMSALSRWIAGINEKGEIKAGKFTKKGMLDPAEPKATNIRGWFEEVTSLTPESRANLGANMFYDNIASFLSTMDDPHEAGKYLVALSRSDMDTWAQLGSQFADSPEFYTVLPALKDFNGKALDGIVQAWDATQNNRDGLLRLADILGTEPAKLLDELAEAGTKEQDFARIVEKLKQSQSPQAKLMLDEIGTGRFSPDTLGQIVDVFTGDGALPWHPGQWRATMLDALGAHFDEWAVKNFNLKPDSGFYRVAHLLKSAQSILLLGGSPGYALTNAMSNMVHRAVTGVFGYLSQKQIDTFLDKFGVKPARLEEGFGMAGMTDIQSTTVKTEGIREAKRGRDRMQQGQDLLNRVGRGMPFNKLSAFAERIEGKMAYMLGMKDYWSQSWRRGIGFSKMPAELVKELNAVGINPNRFYDAIEAGLNVKDIEDMVYKRNADMQARALVHEAAQNIGMSTTEASAMLEKVGVLDALDEYMKGAIKPDDLDRAFNNAINRAQDQIDIASSRDAVARAEHISQRVAIEGAKSLTDIITDVEMQGIEKWIEHYERMGQAAEAMDIADPAQRGKIWELKYSESNKEFRRFNAMRGSTYLGIVEAIGLQDNPNARAWLSTMADTDATMDTTYRFMRDQRNAHFEKWRDDWDNPKQWDDRQVVERRIDKAFKQAMKREDVNLKNMSELLGRQYETLFGEPAGEAARQAWDQITQFRREMVTRQTEFRDQQAQARAAGVPYDLRQAQATEFWSKTYTYMIHEMGRVKAEAIARLDGLTRGDLGTPQPGKPPEGPAGLVEQAGIATADEIKNLQLAAEARRQAKKQAVTDVWQVASEFSKQLPGDSSNFNQGNFNDRFQLLGAMRKAEYGGDPTITKFEDIMEKLTPDDVRRILDKRREVKALELEAEVKARAERFENVRLEAIAKASKRKAPENIDILTFIRKNGGIDWANIADITGETNAKGWMPGVFSKTGARRWGLDQMATIVANEGRYNINLNDVNDPGGVAQLTDLMKRANSGEKIYPVAHEYATEAIVNEALGLEATKIEAEAVEVEPTISDWRMTYEEAAKVGDFGRMTELMEDMPDQSMELSQWTDKLWNDASEKLSKEAQEQTIAENITRSQIAVEEMHTAADVAMTRDALFTKYVTEFPNASLLEVANWMEISDTVLETIGKFTGETLDQMYARFRDVLRAGNDADILLQGMTTPIHEIRKVLDDWNNAERNLSDADVIDEVMSILDTNDMPGDAQTLQNAIRDYQAALLEDRFEYGGRGDSDIKAQNLLDQIEQYTRKNEPTDPLYQIQSVNRSLTDQEVADYALALSRQGEKTVRQALEAEGNKADRLSILDAIHKLDPQLAENVAKKTLKLLFQSPTKGGVTFVDGKAIIHAWEAGDISTIVHENGHVFLEMLRDAGKRTGDVDLLDHLATIQDWVRTEKVGDTWTAVNGNDLHSIKRYGDTFVYRGPNGQGREFESFEQARYVLEQEMFARGFEKYLAEGKAPTPRLARVFENFKSWLLRIYEKIKGSAIDVNLTDDMRRTFDQLLGAEKLKQEDAPHMGDLVLYNDKIMEVGYEKGTGMLRLQDPVTKGETVKAHVSEVVKKSDQRQPAYVQLRDAWGRMSPDDQLVALDWILHKTLVDPLSGLETVVAKAMGDKPAGWLDAETDLNALSVINTTWGHEGGDLIISELGKIAKEETEKAGARAFRKGGDEFSYYFPDEETAIQVLTAIDKRLMELPIMMDGVKKKGFTISYGYGEDFIAADAMMYKDKERRTALGQRADKNVFPKSIVDVEENAIITAAKTEPEVRPMGRYEDGVLYTVSGARVDMPTAKGTLKTKLKAIDRWLRDVAMVEATKRGDTYNGDMIDRLNPEKLSPADKDYLNEYAFGSTDIMREATTTQKLPVVEWDQATPGDKVSAWQVLYEKGIRNKQQAKDLAKELGGKVVLDGDDAWAVVLPSKDSPDVLEPRDRALEAISEGTLARIEQEGYQIIEGEMTKTASFNLDKYLTGAGKRDLEKRGLTIAPKETDFAEPTPVKAETITPIVATYPSVEGTEIRIVRSNNKQGYTVEMHDTDIDKTLPVLRVFKGEDALAKATAYAEDIQVKAEPPQPIEVSRPTDTADYKIGDRVRFRAKGRNVLGQITRVGDGKVEVRADNGDPWGIYDYDYARLGLQKFAGKAQQPNAPRTDVARSVNPKDYLKGERVSFLDGTKTKQGTVNGNSAEAVSVIDDAGKSHILYPWAAKLQKIGGEAPKVETVEPTLKVDETPAEPAPTPARETPGKVTKPKTIPMFETEDLPLFSATPQPAQLEDFAPTPEIKQESMFETRPEFGQKVEDNLIKIKQGEAIDKPANPPEPPAVSRESTLLNALFDRIKAGEWFEKSRDFESYIKNIGFDIENETDLNLAYDVMEGAYNMRAREVRAELDQRNAPLQERIEAMEALETKLTEARRTISKMKLQQFSTPLTISEAAGWVADVHAGDIVGEPTAGTANLVDMFSTRKDVSVVVNEIDPGRREVLRQIGYDPSEMNLMDEGWVISNGKKAGPWANVMISNPPWGSYSTGKYGKAMHYPVKLNDWSQRFTFLELQRLSNDGRFVGVMPANWVYSMDRSTRATTTKYSEFYKWLKKNYTVQGIVESPPGAYKARGTDVSSLLVIIDKKTPLMDTPIAERFGDNQPKSWAEYTKWVEGIPKRDATGISHAQEAIQKAGRPAGPNASGIIDPAARKGEVSAPERIGQPIEDIAIRTDVTRGAGDTGTQPVPGLSEGTDTGNVGKLATGGGSVTPEVVDAIPAGVLEPVDGGSTEPFTYSDAFTEKLAIGRAAVAQSRAFTEYVGRAPLQQSDPIHPHPNTIVETKGLAGVPYPALEEAYRPSPSVMSAMKRRVLSYEGNLDPVWAAIQQNDKHKMGFLVADDVGTGKSRVAAAFVLDRIEKGQKKILVVTKDGQNVNNLMNIEFPQVYKGVANENGGYITAPSKEYPAERVRLSGKTMPKVKKNLEPIPTFERPTVYFITATELANFTEQIKALKVDSVVIDEAHLFKNIGQGPRAASWIELHKEWMSRDANMLYLTATPGSDLADLQYLFGLKVWSMDGFGDWVKVITGEVSAEQVKKQQAARANIDDWITKVEEAASKIVTKEISIARGFGENIDGYQIGRFGIFRNIDRWNKDTYSFEYNGRTSQFGAKSETEAFILADYVNKAMDERPPEAGEISPYTVSSMFRDAEALFIERFKPPGREDVRLATNSSAGIVEASDILKTKERGKWGKKGLSAYDSTLPPAHTEQIMRELKVAGSYMSRDISRAGVEFTTMEYKPSVEAKANMNARIALYRKIHQAFTQFGKMNEGPKAAAAMYGVSGDIQADAKRALFDMRLPGVIDEAHASLARGEQVVISLISVSEVDGETGNLPAALTKINVQKVENLGHGEYSEAEKIPEALIAVEELRDELRALPILASPMEILSQAFGDQITFIHGQISDADRARAALDFQQNKIPIVVISGAGKTGINLHDITGKKRVHLIVGDYEWSATNFKQELGRVDRTGQITSPKVSVMHSGSAGEVKFISTISNRMKGLGAVAKGGAESTGVSNMTDSFELGSTMDRIALNAAWQEFPAEWKDSVLDHHFDDMAVPGVKRTTLETDTETFSRFFKALQSIDLDTANKMYQKFMDKRTELLSSGAEVEDNASRNTAANTGEILRQVDLADNLRITEVTNVDGQKFAVLDGVLTPHMNALRGVVASGEDTINRFAEGGRAWMRWVQFTDAKSGQMVTGLRVPPKRIKDVSQYFGKLLSSGHKPETLMVDLKAGDKVPVLGHNMNEWTLYMGTGGARDGKVVVDGAKMKDRDALMQNGASYNATGNFFFVQEEKVMQFLKRFPIKNDDAPPTLYQDAPILPNAKNGLPLGGFEEASGFLPEGQVRDEGWTQNVKPLLESMRRTAKERQARPPLEGASRDMSPEGKGMLDGYMRKVKNEMATTKLATLRYGENKRDFAMLNYNRRYGFDKMLEVVYPYQFFYTRTMMNWAKRLVDKPALYSHYARIMRQMGRYKRDEPDRLKGKIKISAPWMPDWMGKNLYIDPLGNLFPPAMLMKPFERMQADQSGQIYEAQRVLQEWQKNESADQAGLANAMKTKQGALWERAMAEAKIRREADISNPADFLNSFFGPAWYLSTPLNLAGIKTPISKGDPNKVSNLPLTNTARGIDTVTQGTALEGLGNVIGLLGKPEEWARKKLGLPNLGEYGEYYTKRQIANMVAEGRLTSEQATTAMIEKRGAIWDEATERVKMELAMRVPLMGSLYTAARGDVKGTAQAALPSLFGSGLLPAGELEYRGQKQEWNEAWKRYDAGDTESINRFFEKYPEYEAYLAKGKPDGELLKSFLIGQIWDGYMSLGKTNQKAAAAQMGDIFKQSFLNKETRSYEALDVEMLTQWSMMLKKMTPVTTENAATVEQGVKPLDLYSPEVTQITDDFFRQRTEKYADYYTLEQEYYQLANKDRALYLVNNPKLKEYWDFKKKWLNTFPELEPIIKGKVFQTIDTSGWSPYLEEYVSQYAYTGKKLSKGTRKALEQVWIMEGSPMGNLDSWLNNVVVPAMLYQNQ